MSGNTAEFKLSFKDLVSGGLTKIANIAGGLNNKIDGLGMTLSKLGGSTFKINQVAQAIGNVNSAFAEIVQPGRDFEASMQEVKAITGATSDQMKEISGIARDLGKTFGVDAAQEGAIFTRWLSDVNPKLAESKDAMEALGYVSNLMGKNMKGDFEGATGALTTMLNQFGVDTTNPVEVARKAMESADIITKAAQAGSAEVADLAASVKVAGNTAFNAGLDLKTTAAALEVLGKGSIKGAEAGTGLRNVLAMMGKGAQYMEADVVKALKAALVDINKLSDKTIPFKDRLIELSKVQGDSALISKMFGMENQNSAIQLLKNIPLLEDYQNQINNSAGATKIMAGTIMDSFNEKMARLGQNFKDVGISIFNGTKEFLPFVQFGASAADLTSRLWPAVGWLGDSISFLSKNTKKFITESALPFITSMATMGWSALKTAGQFIFTAVVGLGGFIVSMATATLGMLGLNVAMYANPVGLFVIGILAVIAAVALVITYWDELKSVFMRVGKWIWDHNLIVMAFEKLMDIFPSLRKAVDDIWQWIKDFFGGIWSTVSDTWNKIMGLFDMEAKIDVQPNILAPNYAYNGINYGQQTQQNATGFGPNLNFPGTGLLNQKNAAKNEKKDSSITGESKSRISVVRIGKIEVNNSFGPGDGSLSQSAQQIGDQIVNEILSAVYDMQKTLITVG